MAKRLTYSVSIANEQEEMALTDRRIAQAKSFDAQPCTESKLDDLALGRRHVQVTEGIYRGSTHAAVPKL